MSTRQDDGLLGPLFGANALGGLYGDRQRLQAMLDFEAALARAEARCGVIPAAAAAPIVEACRADLFDLTALGQATLLAGNPAIPLVKALTAKVAEIDPLAAPFVHWGATSQDVIDNGMVLPLGPVLDHFDAALARVAGVLAALADQHRNTVMVGRTLLQHALPSTLGLKAAGWLDAISRHRVRLQEVRGRALVLQFGGASGTLASLGERGLAVAEALAEELELSLPSVPWHTHRDRLAEVATVLGLLAGTLGKIGWDIAHAMSTEVGELFEPAQAGKGGSSALPHKRNPVGAVVAQAAALRVPGLVATMLTAMVQEHERAVGGWHAEWDTLPQIVELTAGALAHVEQIVAGLEIDPERMAANVDLTHGLILAEAVTLALGAHLGRPAAYALVEQASRAAVADGRHLREVLAADPRVTDLLDTAALDHLFEPHNYLGASAAFIDRALAAATTTMRET